MWKLLLGNPYALIGMGVGALFALTAAFGGGYYVAVSQQEKIAATAVVRAADAQETKDVEQHEAAVVVSQAATVIHEKGDTIIKTVIQKIPQIVYVDRMTCDVTVEAIKLLNEAGHLQ